MLRLYFNIDATIVEALMTVGYMLLYALIVERCCLRCQSFHEEVNKKLEENSTDSVVLVNFRFSLIFFSTSVSKYSLIGDGRPLRSSS